MSRNLWILVLGAALGIVRAADGQTLIRTHEGPASGGEFGHCVAALPDLDGDGVRDYAIADPGHLAHTGVVTVYSGATGTTLFTIQSGYSGTCQTFGYSLSDAGDANGDGVPDLLVGDPWFTDPARFYREGSVRVCSGLDGSTIREFFGPWDFCEVGGSVAGLDDIDQDGVPDLLVSARPVSDPYGPQHLFAASGKDGRLLYEIDLDLPTYAGWVSPEWSGIGVDRDGDGFRDVFLLGSDNFHLARAVSGVTGATIAEMDVGNESRAVSETDDVDGDGRRELLVTTLDDVINVVSIETGAILWSHDGRAVVTVPDLDGDGVGELLITELSIPDNFDLLTLRSGRTGGPMAANVTELPKFHRTESATLGDVDGDGLFDLFLSDDVHLDPWTHLESGRVEVRSNDEFFLEADPNPAAPSVIETLTAGRVPAGNPIGLALVDLGGVPTFQFIAISAADPLGRLVVAGTVPSELSGSSAMFQAFAIDHHGHVVATPGLTVEFH